jgi:hypothetical protein
LHVPALKFETSYYWIVKASEELQTSRQHCLSTTNSKVAYTSAEPEDNWKTTV